MRAYFILGTAAELIKMYPVIRAWEARGFDYYVWNTGQSRSNFLNQYQEFGLHPDRFFCLDDKAEDLKSRARAAIWFARCFLRTGRALKREILAQNRPVPSPQDLAFVHGDTLSTVMGCFYARQLGLKITHVEAGMRSGSLWEPFPEEINRRIASRFADYHFAPDENAANHLRRERRGGIIRTTNGNTVLDALKTALRNPAPADLPKAPYAVANLHRFENLHSETKWMKTVEVLCESQKIMPTYFVMHPPTKSRLGADPKAKSKLAEAGVPLLDRMGYVRYAHLMRGASYLITDSGSNQQESSYLGTPCLILREHTESIEGLGENVVLSKFETSVIQNFLSNHAVFRRPVRFPEPGPTEMILTELNLPALESGVREQLQSSPNGPKTVG